MLRASFKSVITDYVTRHAPFVQRPDYFQYLLGLAVELRSLKTDYLDIEPEPVGHYAYVLMDPRKPGRYEYELPSGRRVTFSFEPFYVGKGTGARSKYHSSDHSLRVKSYKSSIVKAIRAEGKRELTRHSKDPLCSEYLAMAYEIDLIAGIGRRNLKRGPLANLTDGGEGMTGCRNPHASETKRKIGIANLGKKRTAKQNERRREARLGFKNTDDTIERMRLAALNRPAFKRVTCPHCEKKGAENAMNRYHFDNCKHKEA